MKLTILALAIILAGCSQEIDFDLNNEEHQRLVVDGWITDLPGPQTIRLTKTTAYFANEPVPPATGAKVSVSDGDQTIILLETLPGIYQTPDNFSGEAGKTYTLEINFEDQTYEADAYLDPIPPIDSVSHRFHRNQAGDEHYDLFLFVQEKPGVGDHYMWHIYRNGEPQTDSLKHVTFVEDDLVDGNYIANWQFDYVDAEPGDSIKVEMWSISKETYEYFQSIMLETDWRGGPFDGPPANVPSNISNGALGFFSASAISTYRFVIEE